MKRKRPSLLQIFIGVDMALLLVACIIFGWIFSALHKPENKVLTATADPSAVVSPPESVPPSPSCPPVPTHTPEPLTVYETEWFSFSYNAGVWTPTDRSSEAGRTAVCLTAPGEDLPRLDIQVLEAFPSVFGQEDFRLLARAAVQAYFAETPAEIAEHDMVMEKEVCTAAFVVPAAEDSPALEATVQLGLCNGHGVLSVYLTEEGAAENDALMAVLESIVYDAKT